MARPWRMFLMVTVCLAAAGCGEKKSDSNGASPKAGAGKDSGLGVKRFAALEAVFVATVPLDKYREEENIVFEKLREDAEPVRRACDALPQDDALMRELRGSCPLITELAERSAALGTCSDRASCARGARAYRSFIVRLLAESRRTDRVISARKGLTEACKQALKTPAGAYPTYEVLDSGLALLQRALKSPSQTAVNSAQQRLDAADTATKALPSGKALLGRFRSACD